MNRSSASTSVSMAEPAGGAHGGDVPRSHLGARGRSADAESRRDLIFQPLCASEPTLPAVGARGGTTRKPQIGGTLSSLGAPLRSVFHEMNGSGCRGTPAAASPFDLIEPRFRSMRQARSASSRVPAGATTRRAHRIGRGIRRRPRGPQRGRLFRVSGEGRGGRGHVRGSGPDLAKPTARAMTPPLDPCRSARRDREARRERLLMLEEDPTLAPRPLPHAGDFGTKALHRAAGDRS